MSVFWGVHETGYVITCQIISSGVSGGATIKRQKQIWFLLRLIGRDSDVCLRATQHPEFDAWRWSQYWVPLDAVIEFKRDVYTQALNELSAILFRRHHETRYLRQRVHGQRAAENLPEGTDGHAHIVG